MPWRFHSNNELAAILGISVEEFHRNTKKLIKRDFKKELEIMHVTNPDILLDENMKMAIADPRDHTNFFVTDLEISAYL